jgi:hypothetical protein
VDDLEKAVRDQNRIRRIINIVSVAFLARGLMAPRGGGSGGGGGIKFTGGPTHGGATAAVAVSGGAVGSVEWVEALRRLVAIGAISSVAAAGRVGERPPPEPAKATLTASAPVIRRPATPKPSSPVVPSADPAWASLEATAKEAVRGRPTGSFGTQAAKSGNREVIVVEGEVRPPVADEKLVGKARGANEALPREHRTHSVGAQLGENLPEAITSGPASALNLSPLKIVENATREVWEAAILRGSTVETQTILYVEHRVVGGETVRVLVGVRRLAWERTMGTIAEPFLDFEAGIDSTTRAVTIVRNLLPPR